MTKGKWCLMSIKERVEVPEQLAVTDSCLDFIL